MDVLHISWYQNKCLLNSIFHELFEIPLNRESIQIIFPLAFLLNSINESTAWYPRFLCRLNGLPGLQIWTCCYTSLSLLFFAAVEGVSVGWHEDKSRWSLYRLQKLSPDHISHFKGLLKCRSLGPTPRVFDLLQFKFLQYFMWFWAYSSGSTF